MQVWVALPEAVQRCAVTVQDLLCSIGMQLLCKFCCAIIVQTLLCRCGADARWVAEVSKVQCRYELLCRTMRSAVMGGYDRCLYIYCGGGAFSGGARFGCYGGCGAAQVCAVAVLCRAAQFLSFCSTDTMTGSAGWLRRMVRRAKVQCRGGYGFQGGGSYTGRQ